MTLDSLHRPAELPTTLSQRAPAEPTKPEFTPFELAAFEPSFEAAHATQRPFSCAVLTIDNLDGLDDDSRDIRLARMQRELARLTEAAGCREPLHFEGGSAYLALPGQGANEATEFVGGMLRAARGIVARFPAPRPSVSAGVASNKIDSGAIDDTLELETLLGVAREGAEVAASGGGGQCVHTELYGLVQARLARLAKEAETRKVRPARFNAPSTKAPGERAFSAGAQPSGPQQQPSESSKPARTEPDRVASLDLGTESGVVPEPSAAAEPREAATGARIDPSLPQASPGSDSEGSSERMARPPARTEAERTPQTAPSPAPFAAEEPAPEVSRTMEFASEDDWREIRSQPDATRSPEPAPAQPNSDGGTTAEDQLFELLMPALAESGLDPVGARAAGRALMPVFAQFADSERARSRQASREREQLLERRVAKLRGHLEEVEAQASAVGPPTELEGLPSVFKGVQGLSESDEQFALKRGLLEGVLRANLELVACLPPRS